MPRGSGAARGRGPTRGRSHDAGARLPKRAKFEHDAEPAHARVVATGARIALDGEVEVRARAGWVGLGLGLRAALCVACY